LLTYVDGFAVPSPSAWNATAFLASRADELDLEAAAGVGRLDVVGQ
jgi:hypothetical protein